jgi:hypothetical protein
MKAEDRSHPPSVLCAAWWGNWLRGEGDKMGIMKGWKKCTIPVGFSYARRIGILHEKRTNWLLFGN